MPERQGKKNIVSEFDAHFPGIIDPMAFISKVHVNDVGTTLATSALAFEKLAAVDADRWSLAVWDTLSQAEAGAGRLSTLNMFTLARLDASASVGFGET